MSLLNHFNIVPGHVKYMRVHCAYQFYIHMETIEHALKWT